MYTNKKERAIFLRTNGRSYSEIARELGISKSSVSLWIREIPLNKKASERIGARKLSGQRAAVETRKKQTRDRLKHAQMEAERLVAGEKFTSQHSRVWCALLYWCEGAKSPQDSVLTFTNSDPLLVKAFLVLMRNGFQLNEKKFRVLMHLHPYHNEIAQRKFWSNTTNIPESQFTKTFWKSHSAKTKHPGYPGCIHVKYYDVSIARTISATARSFLKTVVK